MKRLRHPHALLLALLATGCATGLAVGCGGGDSDVAPTEDTGADDTGASETADTGTADTGSADTGTADTGSADTTATDSTATDSTATDSTATDSTAADSTTDSTATDAPTDAPTDAVDAASCDDKDPCTADSVDGTGACKHDPLTGPACDDGNACNGTVDRCVAGKCAPGHPGTLRDDFPGSAVDGTKWTTNTSAPSSSLVVAANKATLTNRAMLTSAAEYHPSRGAVRVTAQWAFTAGTNEDFFRIVTRSDGTPDAAKAYEVKNGVTCAIDKAGVLSMGQFVASTYTNIATSSTALTVGLGPTVIVEMFDDGTNVTCTARTEASKTRLTLTGTSSLAPSKSYVSLYNRENFGSDHTGQLRNVTIEPGVGSRPYAQWQFEDATASSVIVDWAAAYDGTYGTSAGHAAGKLGNNVNVVGNTNSYADLGTSLGGLGTSDFTMTFWTKAAKPSASKDFLGNRDSSSGGQYFGMRVDTAGKFGVEMYGTTVAGGALTSPTVILDDTWHFAAVERKGATLTLFVDGAQVATGPVTGVPNVNSSKTFLFGKSPFTDSFTNYFSGALDDLRLYGSALSTCEVKNVYGTP